MAHQRHLKSVPSMIEKTSVHVTHKTTPMHKEFCEDGANQPVDCKDLLTDQTIESVNDKLQQIADSREKDESEASAFSNMKTDNSKEKEKVHIFPSSEEEIGNLPDLVFICIPILILLQILT